MPDVMMDPQTLNLYSYVRNNPLYKNDPDGHCGYWDLFNSVLQNTFQTARNIGVGDAADEKFADPGSIEHGEDYRVPLGGDFRNLIEPGIAEHSHHHVAAFIHAAAFGGDGGLADPVL